MNSVSAGHAILQGGVRQSDPDGTPPKKLSGDAFREYLGALKKQLEARPASHPAAAADGKAMQANAAFDTQRIAQAAGSEDSTATSAAEDKMAGGKSDAVKAFLEYMAKTPEERYFEAFLNSKGMTKEQFEALPPDEKQALLKEFEEYVKQHVDKASAERIARSTGSGLF